MISFIVPAHNEQGGIGRTLQAIREAGRVVGQPYEIIVVDDASTDATAAIALQHHATVLRVNHRQISATRNSGARAASGGQLFFVDADTTIGPRVVVSALRAMHKGAAGGGAPARFEGIVPLYARLLLWWLGLFMRLSGISAGAFMFCTRKAFDAVGGFDERLFGAEDAAMSTALKREGRFVVLWDHVLTSGRRARGIHGLRMVAALFRMAVFHKILTQRSSVQKIWYDSNRDEDSTNLNSLAVRISNSILLLVMLVLIAGSIGNFIPWSLTPAGSLLSNIRIGIEIFCCHVGLVLWACAYFLLRSLFRQKRWLERIKLVALIALCVWFALGGTREVIRFWTWLIIR